MEFQEILQIIKKPRNLTEEELSSISSAVYDYLYDEKTSYDLFLIWDDFFQKTNFDLNIILGLQDTFFKWYSIVYFKNIVRLESEHMANILPYTFMMGFYLDLEVPYLYTDYLMAHILEDKEQTRIHKIVVEKVIKLNLPFDYKSGISIKNLIALKLDEEKSTISDDDIERSKIRGSLEEFLANNDFFNLKSSEKKIERVNKLLQFFKFLSDPQGIEKFRPYYLQTVEYLPSEREVDIVDWMFDAYFRVYGNPVIDEVNKKIEEENKLLEKETSVLSYANIKLDLEQQFSYDEAGELQPIEEVLAKLSQLAEENNDEKIEELYMFDEDAGKFIWDDDLLRQS
ncbi:MAG: hypothetical protein PHQ18_00720 [Patescibacteria group bacterium]|nr:hypothetical protein [Patescibacteria group bacterium]